MADSSSSDSDDRDMRPFARLGSEVSQPDGADYRRDRLWSNASEGGGGADYQNRDKKDKLLKMDREGDVFYSNQDLVVV